MREGGQGGGEGHERWRDERGGTRGRRDTRGRGMRKGDKGEGGKKEE